MSKTTQALEIVQNLYAQQVKLWNLLDQDLSSPLLRKEAREQVKVFQVLLRKADWRYMGGEDVYATLEQLPQEMGVRLKKSSAEQRRKK